MLTFELGEENLQSRKTNNLLFIDTLVVLATSYFSYPVKVRYN